MTEEPARDVRADLIDLAERQAAATPGVAGLERSHTGSGVACVVQPEGGYELTLRVVADPVPLPALAERLREGVLSAARATGVDAQLGAVVVIVADISDAALPA